MTVQVFDMNHQLVKTLLSETQTAGLYHVDWNQSGSNGLPR